MAKFSICVVTLCKLCVAWLVVMQNPNVCSAAKLGAKSSSYEWGGTLSSGSKYTNSLESENTQGDSDTGHVDNETRPGNIDTTFEITVFPWNNHLGRPAKMTWTKEESSTHQCKDIPSRWQGKVRSVNTHDNCIVLYSHDLCRGTYRVIKKGSPSHNRLSDLCFQKKPTSARPCSDNEMNDN